MAYIGQTEYQLGNIINQFTDFCNIEYNNLQINFQFIYKYIMKKFSHKILVVFAIVYFAAATYAPSGNPLGLAQPYQYVVQSSDPQIPVDQSADIYGLYSINWISTGTLSQNVDVQISKNTIQYQGCNTQTASFSYNIDTKIYSIGRWASTRVFCPDDKDSIISSAFNSGRRLYKKSNGLVVFEDGKRNEVVRLFTRVANPINPPVFAPSSNLPAVNKNRPTINKSNWPYSIPESQFPQLNLPGVSCNSIQGTYFFKPSNSELPAIIVTFDDSYLQFEGCNIQRIPYAVFTDGIFVLLQGGSSTERQCLIDNDAAYISLLRSVRKYQKTDNGYAFNSRRGDLVASLQTKVRNKIVTYGVINGGYQVEIQGIDVYVSQNSIGFFAGCNSISIPYQLDQYNAVVFGNVISTQRFCEQNNDAAYISAITQAYQLKRINEGFALLDYNGVETARFVNYQRQYQSDYNYFGGNYKLQIPNGGIRLKVSDGVFTLEGCNTFNFKFTLSDNGNIVFGSVSATSTTCSFDNDKLFLSTLLKAQSIAVIDKNLLFFNGNGLQIAKAVNFDISSNPTKLTVLDSSSSPILPTTQFFIADGNYKFAVVRTSLKTLSLTVEKNKISFKGCNIVNFIYTAASDGAIKFTYQFSTKIACSEDYDNLYIKALESTIKYSAMKGMYTFYNQKGTSVASFVSDFGTGSISTVTGNPPITPKRPRAQFKPVPESYISLKGKYKFQLPDKGFQIINGAFVFKGCNTYRFPCAFKNKNIYFGQPISTNNQCGSIDNLLVNLIPQFFNFKNNNGIYTFFDQQSRPILSAGSVSSSSQQSNENDGIISGSYEAQIPNIDIQIDDNNFSFLNCNQDKYGYKAKNNGDINFEGGRQSCPTQYYDAYSSAVQNSARYRKIDSGFILEDKDGNEKGRCFKI